MKAYQREAIRLAGEILLGSEFNDISLPVRQKLVKCPAGSFIPKDFVCYGNHTDIRCFGCRHSNKKEG